MVHLDFAENNVKSVAAFSHYNHMEAICFHENQSSDPIWSKTLCSLTPFPMMLQIKFGRDQPAVLRDIHARNGLRTHGRTLALVLFYKLTSKTLDQVS